MTATGLVLSLIQGVRGSGRLVQISSLTEDSEVGGLGVGDAGFLDE